MAENMLGTIKMFGGNFAPRGWHLCDGQLLPIQQNQALFSILGTIYGGDGRTTFALPDLRGRAPMHAGSGPGLTPRRQGARGGLEQVTLTTQQLPAHSHAIETEELVDGDGAASRSGSTAGPMTHSTRDTGGAQPHDNQMPYQVVNYIICSAGLYPSRS